MAWTSNDLANIERAIASGTLSASVGGVQQTYRSLDEMIRIRDMIREALGAVTNGGITWHYPAHSKGLNS
jgi:hypothetical protein